MRRLLSISLILLLWLPAVVALVPGSDESPLPACCRRHGVHHCAMDDAPGTQNNGTGPGFHAPSRCPQFPVAKAAVVSPAFFIAAAPGLWPALESGLCSRVARRDAARPGLLRAQLDRGPPASRTA